MLLDEELCYYIQDEAKKAVAVKDYETLLGYYEKVIYFSAEKNLTFEMKTKFIRLRDEIKRELFKPLMANKEVENDK